MNILIDRVVNVFHWFDMFFPGKKDKIDWKEVGQMRTRLTRMRFADKAATTPVMRAASLKEVSPKARANGSMLASFRVMNGKSQDKRALTHWYTPEMAVVSKEKELSARLEAGKRAHEARQTSGSFPAISAEEAEAIYEVSHQQQMTKAAEAKLASFLSGSSDDINDLLFTNFSNVEETEAPPIITNKESNLSGLAGKFPLLSRSMSPAAKSNGDNNSSHDDNISQDTEAIAKLEEAVKLDIVSPAHPSDLEQISPISASDDSEIVQEKSDDNSEKCTSIATARSRKSRKSKVRRN